MTDGWAVNELREKELREARNELTKTENDLYNARNTTRVVGGFGSIAAILTFFGGALLGGYGERKAAPAEVLTGRNDRPIDPKTVATILASDPKARAHWQQLKDAMKTTEDIARAQMESRAQDEQEWSKRVEQKGTQEAGKAPR